MKVRIQGIISSPPRCQKIYCLISPRRLQTEAAQGRLLKMQQTWCLLWQLLMQKGWDESCLSLSGNQMEKQWNYLCCNETPRKHIPWPKDQASDKTNTSAQWEELSGDHCTTATKIHIEALTRGNNNSADSRFPIYQTPPFLLTTSTDEMTTKQDEKHCAVACTISWVAYLMELAQHVCDVVGSFRDIGA